MKRIFSYVIQNKDRLCVIREDQLLLYVREEKRIGKSCVIYALKTGFTLLNKKNEFMISAPTRYAAEDIRRTTIYIALNINICKAKSLYINVSGIWTH